MAAAEKKPCNHPEPSIPRSQAERKSYGKRLQAARKRVGLTQRAAGLRLGYPERWAAHYVAQREGGTVDFGLAWVYRYAMALGVAPSSLDSRLSDYAPITPEEPR